MYLAYFDESGDDGYPKYSSTEFVLSSVYMFKDDWKDNFKKIVDFRKHLREKYGFPVQLEFHSAEFVTGKDPYHGMFDHVMRKTILLEYCAFVSTLNVKCINVVIDKTRISRPNYDVLKNALTYNIQRIENDLKKHPTRQNAKFIIITDEGRVGKMRSTTRLIQRLNFIPSKFGGTYRKEIDRLIEDPIPKNSKESYFIQLADMICYIVSLYAKQNLCNPKVPWSNRSQKVISYGDELIMMDMLKPVLNTHASNTNAYGVVFYP